MYAPHGIIYFYFIVLRLPFASNMSISRFHAHIAKELDGIVAGAQDSALGRRWRYHTGFNFLANVVAAHIDNCERSRITAVKTATASRNR